MYITKYQFSEYHQLKTGEEFHISDKYKPLDFKSTITEILKKSYCVFKPVH
jgi:hypothetical protein